MRRVALLLLVFAMPIEALVIEPQGCAHAEDEVNSGHVDYTLLVPKRVRVQTAFSRRP